MSGWPEDLVGLRPFELGVSGEQRERLVAAVLRGEKVATSGLLVHYEMDGEEVPRPGMRQVLVGSWGEALGVIEIVGVQVVPLGEVGDDVAVEEGEGFGDLADWRRAHEGFWARWHDEVRSHLGDPAWEPDDETPVVVERFRLVEDLRSRARRGA